MLNGLTDPQKVIVYFGLIVIVAFAAHVINYFMNRRKR